MSNQLRQVLSATDSSDSIAADLHAYNRAFSELELPWQWDANIYRELLAVAGDADCVSAYVERSHAHLLRVYDKTFLRDMVSAARDRYRHAEVG
jgi:hypothetical protein